MIVQRLPRFASRSQGAIVGSSLLALTAAATLSCGSKSSGTFASSGDDGGSKGDDGSAYGSSGGGSSGASSSGLTLADAGGNGGGLGTGTCMDGTYTGTYTCNFEFDPDSGISAGSGDGGSLVITGNISFQLMQSSGSGESFIDTASGTFGGTCCAGAFSISSTLGGMLNCNTGAFGGMLSNGTYMGTGIWALFFMPGTFTGPISADYDGTNFSFQNGTWNLVVPGIGKCPGTWTASYSDQ